MNINILNVIEIELEVIKIKQEILLNYENTKVDELHKIIMELKELRQRLEDDKKRKGAEIDKS